MTAVYYHTVRYYYNSNRHINYYILVDPPATSSACLDKFRGTGETLSLFLITTFWFYLLFCTSYDTYILSNLYYYFSDQIVKKTLILLKKNSTKFEFYVKTPKTLEP